MTDQIDWCVIYVKGVENADALAEVVPASIGGIVDEPFITTPGGVELDATTNASNPKFEAEPQTRRTSRGGHTGWNSM
jgi:hypothetical protein